MELEGEKALNQGYVKLRAASANHIWWHVFSFPFLFCVQQNLDKDRGGTTNLPYFSHSQMPKQVMLKQNDYL